MQELFAWIGALDTASAFLFALPFLVAAAGLGAEAFRRGRRARRSPGSAAPHSAQPRRDTHAWG